MTLKNNNGLSQLSASNTSTRSADYQLFQRFLSADIKNILMCWGHYCQLWINVAVGSSTESLASSCIVAVKQHNNCSIEPKSLLNTTSYVKFTKKGHMPSSPMYTIQIG